MFLKSTKIMYNKTICILVQLCIRSANIFLLRIYMLQSVKNFTLDKLTFNRGSLNYMNTGSKKAILKFCSFAQFSILGN